jgi:ABC-type nitrate/sulfonate/bicarbonate transport system substrate-binding protein
MFRILSLILLCFTIPVHATEIRLVRSKNTSYQPLELLVAQILPEMARTQGKDVTVKLIDLASGDAANDMLLSGQADIIVFSTPQFANINAATGDRIKFLTNFSSYEHWFVCTDPGIKTVRDFKPDTKIAIKNLNANQHILIRQISKLELGDYNALDKHIVLLPTEQIMQVMQTKNSGVTCAVPIAPWQNQLWANNHVHILYKAGQLGLEPTRIGSWARSDWLKNNPGMGELWISAVQQAITEYYKDPERYIKYWITHDNLPLDVKETVKLDQQNNNRYDASTDNLSTYINKLRSMGMVPGSEKSQEDLLWRSEIKR